MLRVISKGTRGQKTRLFKILKAKVSFRYERRFISDGRLRLVRREACS